MNNFSKQCNFVITPTIAPWQPCKSRWTFSPPHSMEPSAECLHSRTIFPQTPSQACWTQPLLEDTSNTARTVCRQLWKKSWMDSQSTDRVWSTTFPPEPYATGWRGWTSSLCLHTIVITKRGLPAKMEQKMKAWAVRPLAQSHALPSTLQAQSLGHQPMQCSQVLKTYLLSLVWRRTQWKMRMKLMTMKIEP